MIGKLDRKNNKISGFTLVEILISLAIFSVIVVSATAIFRASLTKQNEYIDDFNLQDDLKYFLEIFARDIRGAITNRTGSAFCFVENGHTFFTGIGVNSNHVLAFVNGEGHCVIYSRSLDQNSNVYRLRAARRASEFDVYSMFFLTPPEFNIGNLTFRVDDNSTSTMPIVTVNIQAKSRTNPDIPDYVVQTTISPRNFY
jgi:prepilin-type N-terminal cleavage/methylation domain-containing protein